MRPNPYTFGTDQWRAWQKGYMACTDDWKATLEIIDNVKRKGRWRSSVTGQFVARLFGKANPRETVEER